MKTKRQTFPDARRSVNLLVGLPHDTSLRTTINAIRAHRVVTKTCRTAEVRKEVASAVIKALVSVKKREISADSRRSI